MNYQSLYRRYRPQRFGDVAGQEHVSATLRNAVEHNRVAHAYLFSGPRGCGKTTSARILAKALNCTNLQGGEPCCECESCLQVTSGASMDVIEMDAASNNGVDAMRELVSRAALGTSGRRKVYIVDEVHMLSTAASNALLKTLEEPPDHVVFVLATTDPQKVLPTIRSRTQPFEFRLFSFHALLDLVRKVATDAEIWLPDETLQAVARRGNGSARDALSALDQAAAAGGIDDSFDVSEFVRALGDSDPAAVLLAVDRAIERGRDPRQLARDLVELLRNVFLIHMGRPAAADPDLVRALGPAAATRGIETVGEALVDMRDAIEPRIVLEVALLRLVRPDIEKSITALTQRVESLERNGVVVAQSAPPTPSAPSPAPSTLPASPSNSASGTESSSTESAPPAALSVPAAASVPTSAAPATTPAPETAAQPPPAAAPARTLPPLRPNPADSAPAAAAKRGGAADAARAQLANRGTQGVAKAKLAPGPDMPAAQAAPQSVAPAPTPQPATVESAAVSSQPDVEAAAPLPTDRSVDALNAGLEGLLETVGPRARALFRVGRFTAVQGETIWLEVPNAAHLERAREVESELAGALTRVVGQTTLALHTADEAPNVHPAAAAPASAPHLSVVPSLPEELSDDDDVDLTALVDAPDDGGKSALDQITAVFPGTEIVE